MAEDKNKKDVSEPVAEGEGGDQQPVKKSKKKLLIIVAAALVVVLAGAGVFLSGVLGGAKEKSKQDGEAIAKTVYFDMDEFLVNLNNPGNQVSFLKTIITLEIPNQIVMSEVEGKMPRIRDTFQTYLRELRSSDLQGSAGLQRLRAELLLRVNAMLEKGKVTNILFKEVIVQ